MADEHELPKELREAILALEEQREQIALRQHALMQGFFWTKGLGDFNERDWLVTNEGTVRRVGRPELVASASGE